LLDLAGGFLHQGDLLALAGAAMAGLEVAQQALLVGLGDRVAVGVFAHASGAQLLQQRLGGFFEFIGELGNSGAGHVDTFLHPTQA